MGQRLNLEIQKDNKPVANAYYHWSGFTVYALEIAQKAVAYLRNDTSANDLALAVQALISTGASLTESEWEAIGKMDTS